MEPFDFLTVQWFKRAHVYVGSRGPLFRYRFAMDSGAKTVTASAYTRVCFELAEDVTTETFPWDEAGVEQLKAWLGEQYVQKTADPLAPPIESQ